MATKAIDEKTESSSNAFKTCFVQGFESTLFTLERVVEAYIFRDQGFDRTSYNLNGHIQTCLGHKNSRRRRRLLVLPLEELVHWQNQLCSGI